MNGVVSVQCRDVDILDDGRNHGGLKLFELQVLRIGGDVLRSGVDVLRILQLDQTGILQQQKSTGLVGGVVRHGHGGTVLQILQILGLARV